MIWSNLQHLCQKRTKRVRQERHECNSSATLAMHMWHVWDTNDTSATRVQHKCDTKATRTTRLRHECYTNDTSVKRVKNFDFDNDTGKNVFSHPYIYYMTRERLRGEEQFHTKNYLLEMSFPCNMSFKSAPQKLNFLRTKAVSKSCTLHFSCKCPCTFLHSYTQ